MRYHWKDDLPAAAAQMKDGGPEAEVRRLAALAWTTELRRNDDGTTFARIVEFPGCMTEGASDEDAVRNLREALLLWLETELDRGHEIPTPAARRYSGTFSVRTSPWLHRLASEAARRQHVSLNEFVNEAVAYAAGIRAPHADAARAQRSSGGVRGAPK